MTRNQHQREFWGPRDKAGYRCRDCGRTRQEVADIDVHHRQRDRGDHPGALLGLCRRCHLVARHRRDPETTPGESAFAPDTPTTGGLEPKTPSAAGLSP